jgi:hypothetical protein
MSTTKQPETSLRLHFCLSYIKNAENKTHFVRSGVLWLRCLCFIIISNTKIGFPKDKGVRFSYCCAGPLTILEREVQT